MRNYLVSAATFVFFRLRSMSGYPPANQIAFFAQVLPRRFPSPQGFYVSIRTLVHQALRYLAKRG